MLFPRKLGNMLRNTKDILFLDFFQIIPMGFFRLFLWIFSIIPMGALD